MSTHRFQVDEPAWCGLHPCRPRKSEVQTQKWGPEIPAGLPSRPLCPTGSAAWWQKGQARRSLHTSDAPHCTHPQYAKQAICQTDRSCGYQPRKNASLPSNLCKSFNCLLLQQNKKPLHKYIFLVELRADGADLCGQQKCYKTAHSNAQKMRTYSRNDASFLFISKI